MKKLMIAAILPLAGCGVQLDEYELDLLAASRVFAVTQIIAFNEAGVDPINLSEEQKMYAALGCGLIAGGVELLSPDPRVVEEVVAWCAVFQQAAE